MSKLRRFFAAQAIVIAVALAVSTVATYAVPGAGTVTADLLNVRKEPDKNSEVVVRMARDEEFVVVDIKGDWYQIKYGDGGSGWVMSEYVKAVFEVAQISSDGVNARANPSTEATVLKRMERTEKYFVVGSFNDWFKIKLASGETAWVNDDFAHIVGTATRGYENGTDMRQESTIGNVSEPPKTVTKMQIAGDDVNFRADPDIDGEILDLLSEGSVVTVLEGAGEWRRVKTASGAIGYINKMFLANIKVEQVAVAGQSDGKSVVANGSKPSAKKTTTSTAAKKAASASSSSDSGGGGGGQAGGDLVSYAKQFMGIRYKWGGTTTKGFDCSGYTQYVMRHFGVSIPRTSKQQAVSGTAVSKDNLRVGDIIYFAKSGSNRTVNHVGIYIGNGNFIHSSSGGGGKGVTISSLGGGSYAVRYAGARRYMG